MMKTRLSVVLGIGVSGVALLTAGWSADACAQEAASGADNQPYLEEIIVTAEKRETNVQQTPIAISAISGETLQSRQISDIQALMGALPNVDFGTQLGNARIAIRGIGFDNITGGNEGRVAFHQNGVYYSRPYSTTPSFFDIERVEVLRGPQGTLYGRNATGGVVNVITRDPGSDLNGYFNVTVGNYKTIVTEGAIGGPLSDVISARFAFRTDYHTGFGKNELSGKRNVDNLDINAFRGTIKITPSDDVDITLAADYAFQDDHAYGYRFIAAHPETNPALGASAPTPRPLAGALFGGVIPQSPRNETGETTQNERKFYGFSGTVEWDLGGVDLTSITAWRHAEYRIWFETDNTSAPYLAIDQLEDSEQFSQELRLSQEGDRFSWLIGGYYFQESLVTGNRIAADFFRGTPFFNPLVPATACGGRPCTPADLDPRGLSATYFPMGALRTKAYAVFANANYNLTERLGLRVGLRYSDETKRVHNQTVYRLAAFTPLPFPDFPLALPLPCTPSPFCVDMRGSKHYTSFTPMVTLDYKANDDLYFYATWSKGFKSGGFNLGNNQPGFNPEKITNYEAGLKADWFSGRLRTNISAFYYDYKDNQATVLLGTPPVITIINAPGAEQYGVELEAIALPVDNLRLEMNAAWLHSEYKGPFSSVDGGVPWKGVRNLAGNQLVYAPKYTLDLAAEYTQPVGDVDVTLRGEGRYKSRVFYEIFNNPWTSQAGYWKFNAFLTVKPSSGPWSAQFFVRNLTDKTTNSAMQSGAAFAGAAIYGAYDPPRTWGAQLGFKF